MLFPLRGQANLTMGMARPLVVAGNGYSVALRARSRTPAVAPTYMSSVVR
jgi:hypothetical protein